MWLVSQIYLDSIKENTEYLHKKKGLLQCLNQETKLRILHMEAAIDCKHIKMFCCPINREGLVKNHCFNATQCSVYKMTKGNSKKNTNLIKMIIKERYGSVAPTSSGEIMCIHVKVILL